MEIARYWDDNPFVIEHSGHMMFGNKKITPGGHWMGICAIASKQSGADAVRAARAYALTALAYMRVLSPAGMKNTEAAIYGPLAQ